MSCNIALIVVVIAVLVADIPFCTGDAHWDYEGREGPAYWVENYPACGGSMQSPINVHTRAVRVDPVLTPFVFKHYHARRSLYLLENVHGHTAEVLMREAPFPSVSGGGLGDTYYLGQFHFHWGSSDSHGSEHELDGRRYPLEMHLVHHSGKYPNITVAADKPDGLAVMSVLFTVSDTDNEAYEALLRHLGRIVQADSEDDVRLKSLHQLLPADVTSFYRYRGSLTTPPCYESVIWTIFKSRISISSAQLTKFRKLHDALNRKLVDNFRPIQPLNGRVVTSTSG